MNLQLVIVLGRGPSNPEQNRERIYFDSIYQRLSVLIVNMLDGLLN